MLTALLLVYFLKKKGKREVLLVPVRMSRAIRRGLAWFGLVWRGVAWRATWNMYTTLRISINKPSLSLSLLRHAQVLVAETGRNRHRYRSRKAGVRAYVYIHPYDVRMNSTEITRVLHTA